MFSRKLARFVAVGAALVAVAVGAFAIGDSSSSDGSYAAHMFATSGPHHVFVNQDFEVTGAA